MSKDNGHTGTIVEDYLKYWRARIRECTKQKKPMSKYELEAFHQSFDLGIFRIESADHDEGSLEPGSMPPTKWSIGA